MSSGKLWIYMADGCPGCQRFKAHVWMEIPDGPSNSMVEKMKETSFSHWLNTTGIDYETVNVRNAGESPSNGPSVLTEGKVKWNPAFIWVQYGSEHSPSHNLVYSAEWNINSKAFEYGKSGMIPPLTTKSLTEWVKSVMGSGIPQRQPTVTGIPAGYSQSRPTNRFGNRPVQSNPHKLRLG